MDKNKIAAINQTMVDQSMVDQSTIEVDKVDEIQIDSSSPPKKAPYANKWGKLDDDLAFDSNHLNPNDIQKKKISAAMDSMSSAQMEVLSSKLSQIRYEESSKYHYYWCFFLLIMISVINTF